VEHDRPHTNEPTVRHRHRHSSGAASAAGLVMDGGC
jgi:hypothetical protein